MERKIELKVERLKESVKKLFGDNLEEAKLKKGAKMSKGVVLEKIEEWNENGKVVEEKKTS